MLAVREKHKQESFRGKTDKMRQERPKKQPAGRADLKNIEVQNNRCEG